MLVKGKARSLGLEDGSLPDNDEDILESPRRFLQLPFCGTLLAYGGDEGVISARKKNDNNGEFKVIQRYNDMIRAVAVSVDAKRIVVGCDDGSTLVYTFDEYGVDGCLHPFCKALDFEEKDKDDVDLLSQDFAFSSHLKTFPGPTLELPIRDLQFIQYEASSAYWLAIANESGLVLVNVTSSSTLLERELEHQIQEHHAHSGIRGVALTKNKLMATLAMDGRLCLWDVNKKALVEREPTTCIPKKDVGEIHGADAFDRSCRPLFCPLSDAECALLTPGRLLPTMRLLKSAEGTTKVEAYEVESMLPDKGHMEPVVCICDLGHKEDDQSTRYLLTSGRDSRLILWEWKQNVNQMIPLEIITLSRPATDLLKQGSEIMVACSDGNYSVVDLTPHLPSSTSHKADNVNITGSKSSKESSESSTPSGKKALKSKVSYDDLDDDDSDFAFPKSSAPAANKNRVRFVDDEAAENEDDNRNDDVTDNDNTKTQEASKSYDSAFDSDEDSLGEHRPAQKTYDDLDNAMAELDEDKPKYNHDSYASRLKPATPPQPAFSPSSTPLDLARRFLCWNHVGAITILHGEDRNTVDISFTDSAYKRPINFTDNMNFILGSLGEDGGIFATDLQSNDDDDGNLSDDLDDIKMSENTKRVVRKSQKKGASKSTGSAIFFYRFATIGSIREKDWFLTLPIGERVWGAATGSGWAAVATSRNFLRFFSSGGNQGQLVWLKGDPVTMAGRGRFLGVVYQDSTPLTDGTQQLAYSLWDASKFEVIAQGPMACLSKGASLTWLGFSNDSSLMAMDSEGTLSMLVQTGTGNWDWVPVLDTIGLRKSMDDLFWPITVFDGKLVCVPLKGGNTYPDAARRPVTSTLGLRLPLAASAGGKNAVLEEVNVRSNLALAQKRFIGGIEGANAEENHEEDILKLTAQVDKVTLKLFAAFVDGNKLERALDLVDRLHLEMSYDLAIQLAGRHDKLADSIEEAKYRRFSIENAEHHSDDDVLSEEDDKQYSPETTKFIDRLAPQISPEAGQSNKRNDRSQENAFQHVIRKKQRVT